jgi:streptogramin lyase
MMWGLKGLLRRAAFCVLAAGVVLAGVGAQSARADVGTITEYPIPGMATPYGIASGPDGNIWFTDSGNADGYSKVGHMTTSGAITASDIVGLPGTVNQNGLATGIAPGPDGSLWLGHRGDVDKVPTTVTLPSQITEYQFSGGVQDLLAGPDNRMWLTSGSPLSAQIGAMATDGTATNYPNSSWMQGTFGITVGPDNNLWVGLGDAIGVVDTSGAVVHTYPMPSANDSNIRALVLGPDGNVWFTLDTTAAGPAGIGKITPTGTVTIFNTPVSPGQGSLPFGLAVGPDNRIWYADRNADWIGAFATNATSAADVTTYPTNHSNTGLLYITRGSDGRMWFNEFNRNALGAITAGAAPPPTFNLSVTKPGSGSGTVTSTPAGIACGSTCSADFSSGTQVTMTAVASAGSTFAGWNGGGCSGSGSCTITVNADTALSATFNQTPPTTTTTTTTTPPPSTTTTTSPPPPSGTPVNVKKPFIAYSPASNSYVCNAGTWQNPPANQAFAYAWLRRTSGSAASVIARTQTFNPGSSGTHYQFGCQVTVPGVAGSTIPTPKFTGLNPTIVPISAYGNFRIRGIDVFQVVQPNSCAVVFSFLNAPTFPCFAGGGTPTSYRQPGQLAPGADPQRTKYVGVQFDADKRTTAVVYVDRSEVLVAKPTQHLEVTLTALYHGRKIGALTRTITQALPYSVTPWVTAEERGNPDFGVQFQVPAKWLQVARQRGGTIDLVAKVGFPAGTLHLLAVECNPSQLTIKNLHVLVNRDCSADNTFRLDGVGPALRLLGLNIRSVELRGKGQNPGSLHAPGQVLASARQLFPGGESMSVWPYATSLDLSKTEALTATPVAAQGTEVAPVFLCNGVRYASTAPTATAPGITQTQQGVTRVCRWSVIQTVVTQWQTQNPLSGSDATVAVHNYTVPLGVGTVTEPGWTPTPPTLATVSSQSDAVQPLFLVNDGTGGRPLGAAAHEFGHIMGLPHASSACGGSAGGSSEAWLPDQVGRLQGTEFNPTTGFTLVDSPVNPYFDLMSYCGPGASPTDTTGSSQENTLWISPRNWVQAFATLRAYAGLPAAADQPTPTRAAASASASQAFAVGVANAGSARILRVVQPHGPEAIPPTAADSPLRLRALDSGGRVLVDEGVQVQQLRDAPGAATFIAPVPAGAAAVELTSHGQLLDRKQRNRPPTVRLLAPGRRARAHARGTLQVRWSASDPDRDQLQATIDYSFDGGRSWRTVYDGPSTGSASVPGRFLEGSRRARIRVYVNDGFNEARAVSPIFRADGTPPVAQIVRPGPGEQLRASERTLLIGSAFDDRHRPLRGRALTWYVGQHRLGSGEQLEATLPAGRVVLRLVTRDRDGHQAVLRRTVNVIAAPLQLLRLSSPDVVRHRARTITVRIAASTTATLTAGGRRYHVGRRPRTIVIRLPRSPATGLLTLPIELNASSGHAPSRAHGTILVVRL